ncbi:fad dependent oxidoreductase superfamily [Venturia nashicola]|nr:fad dependent oxidoreductase superfamily [Venturia nashicola]
MENTTVIIGSGIIGLSTAYYLSSPASKTRPQNIHLVESSPELFIGSSGFAGGFLAENWFAPTVASLGALSYSLHRSLATEHNGRERWGYCPSVALSLTQDTDDEAESAIGGNGPDWLRDGSSRATTAGSQEAGAGERPEWLNSEAGTLDGISEVGRVAQVDPRRLCEFLLEECLSRGVVLHQPARVVAITKNEENVLAGVVIQEEQGLEVKVACTHVLITAGSWTPLVFQSLFPHSTLKIPVFALAGHSLLVKSPRWTRSQESGGCHAVFAADTLGFSPEIFSRLGEEIYMAGLNSKMMELPANAADVTTREEDIEKLRQAARTILGIPQHENLEVIRESLCFRPITSSGRPVLSRVPDSELGGLYTHGGGRGGVFVSAGHGAWGVSQSLGTGMVMAEMMEGKTPSAKVEALSLRG